MLQKMFPAMGTVNTMTLYGSDDVSTANKIKDRVMELHNRFSFFEPGSDVYRINENAGVRPVQVHPDTMRILLLAQKYENITGGAFSIMCGPSSALWKRAIQENRLPSTDEIERCRRMCAPHSLQVDLVNSTAFLKSEGHKIDLGGIAKGFAADEAARMIKEAHIRHALINFGGTIITLGATRKIGIQDPFMKEAEPIADTLVKNRAVVTSGSYEQFFFSRGRRFHHIVDPKTGCPSHSGLMSVTLIGKSAAELDALATAAYILGRNDSMSILKRIRGIFIGEDGQISFTRRLHGFHIRKEVGIGEFAYD